MRAAAREELARDLAAVSQPGRGVAVAGARRVEANGAGAEKDVREQARGAAVQAQSARAIGLQRNLELQRGVGNGNGNGNGRSALSQGAGPSK